MDNLAQAQVLTIRLQILADASRIFAETGADYQSVVDAVVKVISSQMQGMCYLLILSDDGQWLTLVSFTDSDKASEAMLRPIYTQKPKHFQPMPMVWFL